MKIDVVIGGLIGQVMIPLSHIAAVNPVTMPGNPSARYLQIATVDGHEFWFMGFVNFEKATHHLLNAVSAHNAPPSAAWRRTCFPIVSTLYYMHFVIYKIQFLFVFFFPLIFTMAFLFYIMCIFLFVSLRVFFFSHSDYTIVRIQ